MDSVYIKNKRTPNGIVLNQQVNKSYLKGQCPDYVHARASAVFSSKDNRTVILTRQVLLPDAPPTEICCLYSQVIFQTFEEVFLLI